MRMVALRQSVICLCMLLSACATTTGEVAPDDYAPRAVDGEAATPENTYTVPLVTEIDPSVPEQYRKRVEFAQIEGNALWREDSAAWVATDAVVDQGLLARNRPNATGYLTELYDPSGNQWNVVFTGQKDEKPYAYADVSVDLGSSEPQVTVHENIPPRSLSDVEGALVMARDAVGSWNWLRCSDRYNTSAQMFIDEGKKYIIVRLLPAQIDANIRPRSGFHRYRIPVFEDGEIEHFAQTKTCVNEDLRATQPGSTFAMTLLTTAVPTEFDVFESLAYGQPHFVATSAGSWRIKKGRIYWIGEIAETQP